MRWPPRSVAKEADPSKVSKLAKLAIGPPTPLILRGSEDLRPLLDALLAACGRHGAGVATPKFCEARDSFVQACARWSLLLDLEDLSRAAWRRSQVELCQAALEFLEDAARNRGPFLRILERLAGAPPHGRGSAGFKKSCDRRPTEQSTYESALPVRRWFGPGES
jgi:hypothetical protein